MLTLQFRDLESLPDEDVISCLRQLAELGSTTCRTNRVLRRRAGGRGRRISNTA